MVLKYCIRHMKHIHTTTSVKLHYPLNYVYYQLRNVSDALI